MDHALQYRQAIIGSASRKPTLDEVERHAKDHLVRERIRAINLLGKNWVLHPDYNRASNPHHSNTVKTSVILSKWLHARGALRAGRV